jgi:hypothetical protein
MGALEQASATIQQQSQQIQSMRQEMQSSREELIEMRVRMDMLEKSMKQSEPYAPEQDPGNANLGMPVDPAMLQGGGVPPAGQPGMM